MFEGIRNRIGVGPRHRSSLLGSPWSRPAACRPPCRNLHRTTARSRNVRQVWPPAGVRVSRLGWGFYQCHARGGGICDGRNNVPTRCSCEPVARPAGSRTGRTAGPVDPLLTKWQRNFGTGGTAMRWGVFLVTILIAVTVLAPLPSLMGVPDPGRECNPDAVFTDQHAYAGGLWALDLPAGLCTGRPIGDPDFRRFLLSDLPLLAWRVGDAGASLEALRKELARTRSTPANAERPHNGPLEGVGWEDDPSRLNAMRRRTAGDDFGAAFWPVVADCFVGILAVFVFILLRSERPDLAIEKARDALRRELDRAKAENVVYDYTRRVPQAFVSFTPRTGCHSMSVVESCRKSRLRRCEATYGWDSSRRSRFGRSESKVMQIAVV
jgi:hypothetical protein